MLNIHKLLTTIIILSLTMVGCSTLSLPKIPNLRSYEPSSCEPIYSAHIPNDVSKFYALTRALEKNPALVDKLIPSEKLLDSMGRNAPSLGLGGAAIVSAFKDNLSLASVIGSSVTAGLSTVTDARSEDKNQDRIDACMPKDVYFMSVVTEDAIVVASRDPNTKEIEWIKQLQYRLQDASPEQKESTEQ